MSSQFENCSKCNQECIYKDVTKSKEIKDRFGAPCDSCKQIVCRDCSNITSSEIRAIMTGSRIILFFCTECINAVRQMPLMKTELHKIKKEIEQIKSVVDVLKPEPSPSPSYAEVARKTEELTNQIKSLKEKLEIQESLPKQVLFEPTISEMQERERRSVNVLVFGVNESDLTNKEECQRHDKEKAKDIILKVKNDVQMDSVKCTRLGAPSEGKIRPLKLTFSTKEEALQIVRLKSKLNVTGVYIKYDQTPSQREYLKKIIQELEQRKQNGEENVRIKYVNGIPTIITPITRSSHSKN